MQPIEILTKSDQDTRKLGELLAKNLIFDGSLPDGKAGRTSIKGALVVSLEGDLGAGKTTFTQGFAKGLGVRDIPRSPTFVIMQIYSITPHNTTLYKGKRTSLPLLLIKEETLSETPSFTRRGKGRYSNLIHIDAYRIGQKDLKILGWSDFVKNKKNIILIEWGDKIKNILPQNTLHICFGHIGHQNKRLITISQ